MLREAARRGPEHEFMARKYFTPREVEFLQHLVDGTGNYVDISLAMRISAHTVDTHATNIRTVLQNREEKYPNLRRAVVIAVTEDLINCERLPKLNPSSIKPKEALVFALMLTGYPITEIAERLHTNSRVVENQVAKILHKTFAKNGYQAIASAVVFLREQENGTTL